MPAVIVEIDMVREKECKHSVRFQAANTDPNDPPAIDNAYINRTHPGINQAKRVRVTLEVIE